MTPTAYVTRAEFERSPTHAIDTSQLVPGGTTQENEQALDEILETATEMVNAEIGMDTLAATTGTVERFNAFMNRRFEIIVRPRNRPINAVSSVRYRAFGTTDWTTVDASSIEADTKKVVVIVNSTPTIAGSPLNVGDTYLHPSAVDRLTKIPLVVEITYDHGLTTIPQDVKTATILFATALIKQRGSVAVEMDGSPSVMGGSPYDQGDENKARALLRRFYDRI